MIAPIGTLTFFGAIAVVLATNAILEFLGERRLWSLAPVANLATTVSHPLEIGRDAVITAGISGARLRMRLFRVGRLLGLANWC